MTRKMHILWLLLGSLISVSVFAAAKPMAFNEAFQFSYEIKSHQVLLLKWKLADHYYLYRDKIKVTDHENHVLTYELPKGVSHANGDGSTVEVYESSLNFPTILTQNGLQSNVTVHYQGCSSEGFCYPPHDTVIQLSNTAPKIGVLKSARNFASKLLVSENYFYMIIGFLLLGLLLAFTPCMLPMIPILSSIIVGLHGDQTAKRSFRLSVAYVFGMAVAYACAGIIFAKLGDNIQIYLQKPIFIIFFSFMLVMLAFSMFGLYELRLPKSLHHALIHRSNKLQGGSYINVFLMGVISTLIVSPCVTAPLIAILTFITKSGSVVTGAVALFSLGLGMGIPLLIIGASAGKILPKAGPWMDVVKRIFGMLMLGFATWMSARVLPNSVILILHALLIVVSAIILGSYAPKLKRWYFLNKTICVLLICYALLLVFGRYVPKESGLYRLTQPLVPSYASILQPNFQLIHTQAELDHYLTSAALHHQTVLLDFYADWCTSCVVMDKVVFADEIVKLHLKDVLKLRVDVTDDSDFDQNLMHQFEVVAPPTMIFFIDGSTSQVITKVGEFSSHELLHTLDNLNI